MFAIVEEPLDVGALVQDVQSPDCGAIVTFVGTTRIDESEGAAVEYLEYEAYRPMADRKLEEIGAEIEARWDVREVWSDGYVWVGSQVGTRKFVR